MSTSAEQSKVVEGDAEAQTDESEPESAGDAEQEELSLDDVFHLLQSTRRRLVIKHLRGRDDEVVMRDLVEEVAADEYDTTVEALDSKRRQRVYIALYQRHLPKLDEAGVIDYNQDRGIVKRKPLAETVEARLAAEEDGYQPQTASPTHPEISSGSIQSIPAYLGATAVSLVLIATMVLGLAPAALSGGVAAALAVLAVFLGAFAYEYVSDEQVQAF